jgi:hypothetical protein
LPSLHFVLTLPKLPPSSIHLSMSASRHRRQRPILMLGGSSPEALSRKTFRIEIFSLPATSLTVRHRLPGFSILFPSPMGDGSAILFRPTPRGWGGSFAWIRAPRLHSDGGGEGMQWSNDGQMVVRRNERSPLSYFQSAGTSSTHQECDKVHSFR